MMTMSKHVYKITEYENGLGNVYYTVKSCSGWWFGSRGILGNNKHADAYIKGNIPEPYDTANVNYLYIFDSLKDVYQAIEEDKRDILGKDFKKKWTKEVTDETT